VLEAVASRGLPDTLRLHRTGPGVAFGRQDTRSPGFPGATREVRLRGYLPMMRLDGCRPAVFHRATIAFSWAQAVTETEIPEDIVERGRLIGAEHVVGRSVVS